jgi:hypothetical protein
VDLQVGTSPAPRIGTDVGVGVGVGVGIMVSMLSHLVESSCMLYPYSTAVCDTPMGVSQTVAP